MSRIMMEKRILNVYEKQKKQGKAEQKEGNIQCR